MLRLHSLRLAFLLGLSDPCTVWRGNAFRIEDVRYVQRRAPLVIILVNALHDPCFLLIDHQLVVDRRDLISICGEAAAVGAPAFDCGYLAVNASRDEQLDLILAHHS